MESLNLLFLLAYFICYPRWYLAFDLHFLPRSAFIADIIKQRLPGPQNIIHSLKTFGGMKWRVNEVRFEGLHVELTKFLRVVTMRSISVDESIVVLVGLVMMFSILRLSKMVCSFVLYSVSLESLNN